MRNRERKRAENYNKWQFFFLNCNQHFGNFKPYHFSECCLIIFLPYILFEKCINILALGMACPGNRHCASCISTLSFPIVFTYGRRVRAGFVPTPLLPACNDSGGGRWRRWCTLVAFSTCRSYEYFSDVFKLSAYGTAEYWRATQLHPHSSSHSLHRRLTVTRQNSEYFRFN